MFSFLNKHCSLFDILQYLSKHKLPDNVVMFLSAEIAVIFLRKFENIKNFPLNYRSEVGCHHEFQD